MALKNKIILAIALGTILEMASAQAYIVPGGPAPEQPTPIYQQPDNPYRPSPPPAPIPSPLPGGYDGGGYGPNQGNNGYGNQEQRVIQVRRRMMNEQLSLLQLAGIDSRYDGYTIQSIVVYASGNAPNSQLVLIVNGQRDSSALAVRGAATITPRYQATLGQGQVRDLQLFVAGGADVDSVVLNLQANNNGGGYNPGHGGGNHHGGHGGGGNFGREIMVPLSVARRMISNDQLDISQYIDMYQYNGMRITAIEIQAASVYQVALMDVLINGCAQGSTVQLNNYLQTYSVYPQNAVIGQTASNIVINTRGDMEIRGVTLRLSRR